MRSNLPKIGILGPGAIGIYIAYKFNEFDYPTFLIGRKNDISNTVYEINEHNKISGFYSSKVKKKLDLSIDYLFLTTKYYDLDSALEKLPSDCIKDTMIIPLLNGFMHYEKIKKKSKNVIAGAIGGINASKIKNKINIINSNFEILLSTDGIKSVDKLRNLNQILNSIGLQSKILNSETEVVWVKFTRLSIVSALTAATLKPLGYVKKNSKWYNIMLSLIDEAVSIAESESYKISKKELLNKILSMPDSLETSLQRDIANKKKSEIDVIIGAMLQTGKKNNCSIETFKKVYNLIIDRTNQC